MLTFLWLKCIPTKIPELDMFHSTTDNGVFLERVELNVKYLQSLTTVTDMIRITLNCFMKLLSVKP